MHPLTKRAPVQMQVPVKASFKVCCDIVERFCDKVDMDQSDNLHKALAFERKFEFLSKSIFEEIL